MAFKSGFVAVVGRANVGKSTLVNALIGKKVSIVSPKPQTTRDQILGILNGEDYQAIFIDTPGIHKSKNNLDKQMQESITQATQDVDLLLYVMDGNKDFADDDINRLKHYCKQGYPVFAVVNKMDLGSFESIYPRIARLNEIEGLEEVYVISAKQGKNIDELKQAIIAKLTDTIEYYPRDIYGAQTLEFNLAELIREKMLWLLNEEIPHGVGVTIEKIEESNTSFHINALIYCEKNSHKNIIIGAQGAMLKEIGTECRKAMEKMLGKKVYLELFVRVKENWRNKV